jgi:hypothetical protein
VTVDGNRGGGAPRFAVGRVIATGISVMFGNLLRFLAIAVAVFVPAIVVGGLAIALGLAGERVGPGLDFETTNPGAGETVFFGLFAISVVAGYLTMVSALTHAALERLAGRPVAIGASLSRGVQVLWRVFLAHFLLVIALGLLGFVAVFIFGSILTGFGLGNIILSLAFGAGLLYVLTFYWVMVPAIVVERAGVFECVGRSFTLTTGHRWGIFGILVLIAIANWAIGLANQVLTIAAPIAGGVIDIASGLFILAISPVLAAVGYFYLRAEKEGAPIDDVVRVFD